MRLGTRCSQHVEIWCVQHALKRFEMLLGIIVKCKLVSQESIEDMLCIPLSLLLH